MGSAVDLRAQVDDLGVPTGASETGLNARGGVLAVVGDLCIPDGLQTVLCSFLPYRRRSSRTHRTVKLNMYWMFLRNQ